jgi:transcriptional regulator with XRE-family HTH domain
MSRGRHDQGMTTRERASDVGAADAWRLSADVGREIQGARRSAGATQQAVAVRAGVSRTQLGRLERGELRSPPLALICQAARATGFSASLKLYPDGTRLRDAGQLRVLARFDRTVAAPLRIAREMRLPTTGDLRAWDERLTDGRATASVECEVHLHDIQAVQRRIALKQRDDPQAGVVILLLADSAHNRRVLAEHREALRAEFPLDGGAILRALRAGRVPPASGILLL